MLKKIIISVLLIFIVVFTASTQTVLITVSGHVTNTNGGLPVADHEVFIKSDSIGSPVYSYFNIVITDVNGYYSDSIMIPTNSQILFEVFTFDCLSSMHSTTLVSSNPPLIADFQICDSINTNCAAFFTTVPDSMNPLNINFVDLSSPNIDNWLWEFGDGTISTLQNPVHHYPDTGLYLVCLHVSSGIPGTSNYCEDTFCDSILITMAFPPCHANFTIVNNPADPLTFTFINHSFGNFNELLWDFGDGDFSFNYSPTHKYKNPGTYNVCLSVYHINYPTSDTLCVDKQCKQLNIPPPSFYNLAGQVFANFFPVNICNIYLYRLLGNGNIFLTDTAKIDTIGVYYFYQIPAGKYLIKAEPVPNTPLYNKNLPTYYGNVLHWMNGDVINLNSNFFSANVNLLPYQSMGGGSGSIQGKITIEGKYSNKGNPAPHVEILLLNMQNIPVKIDYSDHNGNFKFPDLPFGAYQVYAEIAGKNTIPVQVVLDINNPAVNDINLIITPFAIIASVEENVSENIECIGDIYPNPSDNEAYIDIVMLKTSKVKLNIINCFGQVLISEDNQLTTGKNRTQLNVAGLNTGLYILQIIEDNKSLVMKRLIKIH